MGFYYWLSKTPHYEASKKNEATSLFERLTILTGTPKEPVSIIAIEWHLQDGHWLKPKVCFKPAEWRYLDKFSEFFEDYFLKNNPRKSTAPNMEQIDLYLQSMGYKDQSDFSPYMGR